MAKRVDGNAFCEAALADIRARTSRGEKVRVVFDIDDTLSDSRARTLAIARDWDQARGTHHFDGLTRGRVGHDGAETAAALKLPPDVQRDFAAHWNVEFWKGERFVHDTPIAPVVALAKAAKAAGAEVIYLTGRVDALEGATRKQLRSFGLPDVDAARVVSKPGLSVRTAPFKTQWLKDSAAQGNHLAWFFTESKRDIGAVQKDLPAAPCVLLSSGFNGKGDARADTPVFLQRR